MSLQKLEADNDDQPLLASACKATQQLEMIVHGLTEAAHIDDALSRGDYSRFDLAAMLNEYIENSRQKHGAERFSYSGPFEGVYIRGNDLRIAQLLDKLKDNALDFSPGDSKIEFKLTSIDDGISLSVTNTGTAIPEEIMSSLFAGMVSSRSANDDKPHLGIGLFIANRIAQQHGGELNIANRNDGKGVTVSVWLPSDN
jgi:signal transduction histidine kinase